MKWNNKNENITYHNFWDAVLEENLDNKVHLLENNKGIKPITLVSTLRN